MCLFTTQASDIKFYVLYAVFAKSLEKVIVSSTDVADIRPDSISDNFIIETSEEIFGLYTQLGGNDKIAKGTGLISALKENFSKIYFKDKLY